VVATQTFFIFSPKIGEDSHFDKYFSNGLKPPTSILFYIQVAIFFGLKAGQGRYSLPTRHSGQDGQVKWPAK